MDQPTIEAYDPTSWLDQSLSMDPYDYDPEQDNNEDDLENESLDHEGD